MPNKKEDLYRRAYDQLCAYMDEHKLRYTPERFNIFQSLTSQESRCNVGRALRGTW